MPLLPPSFNKDSLEVTEDVQKFVDIIDAVISSPVLRQNERVDWESSFCKNSSCGNFECYVLLPELPDEKTAITLHRLYQAMYWDDFEFKFLDNVSTLVMRHRKDPVSRLYRSAG